MKILHTSDWHIGRALYGRKRYAEVTAFLRWLLQIIEEEQIEALLIAGDVFDTSTPSNRAQQLYYQFLKDVTAGSCRHVIIVGGNHDSPSLLEAPRELLRFFQVHVVGSAAANPEDEVIVLRDPDGNAELIVCAVPYLRDREIRSSQAGESIDDKNRNMIEGIANHYRQVVELGEQLRNTGPRRIPLVATGHLFMAGGRKVEGDGVRDLYVGSLMHIDCAILPDSIDYLALGHLHSAQIVGGNPARRYCGSPLPMSFQEAVTEKQVLAVVLEQGECVVTPILVPRFQRLQTIRGNLPEILETIATVKYEEETIWLEVLYDGEDLAPQLQHTLREAIADSSLEILRIVNNRVISRILEQNTPQETLDTLTEEAVFRRCLDVHEIPELQAGELLSLFRETLQAIGEEDSHAEY